MICLIATLAVGVLTNRLPAEEAPALTNHHRSVLSLKPVGYWPADDGAGEILHDRSGNGNHGRILEVPWENGLLNFTGAYQWAEIPDHEQYQSRAFTIGGWVFNRGKIIGGAGGEGALFFGNAFHRSGYTLATLYDRPTLYRKSEWGIAGGSEGGISLCLRREERVDIVSGGAGDAIGTRAEGVAIVTGEWQHVLYTYEAGVPLAGDPEWRALQDWSESYDAGRGELYVNGQLAQARDGVRFKRRDMRFLIGPDALWWLQSNHSGSLDGSVHDMVMFNRVLSPEEVAHLHDTTGPAVTPHLVCR